MVMRPQLEVSVIKFAHVRTTRLCVAQEQQIWLIVTFAPFKFCFLGFVFLFYLLQVEKVGFEIFIFSYFLRFLSHITLSLALPWRAKQTAQIAWMYTRYIFLNLTQPVRSQKRQQLSITLSPPSGFRRRGHHQAVKVFLMVIHKGQTYEMFANKETRASICSKLKTTINHALPCA